MKITAMIEDEVIKATIKYSNAKNITEAIKIALQEYIAVQKTKELIKMVEKEPLEFKYSAEELRNLNRQV